VPGRAAGTGGLTAPEDADVVTSSAAYARRFAGPVGAWFLETQARITLELLRPWPGARVLDVGGGHGQLLGPLLDAGHDVTVYGSAEVCRDRIAGRLDGSRARFQAGDLLRAPWPAGAFDVVVSYRLLPHVAAWRDLLGELCRLARRAVLLDYPTRRSVNAAAGALFAAKKTVEGDTRPFAVFRDADVEAALTAHGFRATARRPEFFFPMALHRTLGIAAVSRALESAARGLGLARALGSPVILRAEPRG
jgi:2-polyprenyl-3-methyl-5-hydroxy-6-metoxy-1,4-benzoquinol methylase